MMYRFSSFVLALLLLVASGQVMAATASSKVANPAFTAWNAAHWSDAACGATMADATAATAFAGNDLVICGTTGVAVGTVVADAAITTATLTVNTGASIDFNTKVVTLTGALTNAGGTITTGAALHVLPSIVNTAGTTTLTSATTTSVAGAVTYTAGTLLLPTALTTITGLFTSAASFTMPSTVTTLTGGVTVTGGALTLSSANVVGNTVTLNGGTIAGTLKFTSGDKAITATDAAKTIPTLDVSGMAANDTITINGNSVTFSSVYGGALKCLATGVTTDYTPGTAVAATGVCTVTIATSVPVFSTKELPKVFAEEVK